MAETTIKLGRKLRQPDCASIKIINSSFFKSKESVAQVKQFEKVTLVGKNLTGYLGRGNPGVAILIDGKPLTGTQLNRHGDFKITFEMPPFEPGIHIIDAFGIQTTVEVLPTTDLISQEQLHTYVIRDFILAEDCHILYSDARYRVTPIQFLKDYLATSCVPAKQYVAEFYDCDNFALSMSGIFDFNTYPKGYAHGEIWVLMPDGGGHAVDCWCVLEDDNVKMKVVEPQTGQLYDFPGNWKVFMIKV